MFTFLFGYLLTLMVRTVSNVTDTCAICRTSELQTILRLRQYSNNRIYK